MSAARFAASVAAVGALMGAPPAPAAVRTEVGVAGDTLPFFPALRWRSIGPNRGGRSLAVGGSAARPLEYFFGATGGGVWKTTDGGTSWRPVSDRYFRTSSVGALAVCEANPDVVYVGMGEADLRGNIMQGDGIYKTTDGGKIWTHVGLPETQAIGRIRIAPRDCDRVFVAALGHPYGPNRDRGVYRTRDGGRNWEQVLFRNDRTGAVDLALDPANPDVLYATLWQVYRTPWGLYSGGSGSGLFKSVDGGDRWTELTRNPGLPRRMVARAGISVSGADSRRVYAIVEADDGGIFRSDDAGATWERTTDDFDLWERGYYYTHIVADPKDRETVYVLNIDFTRSTDGGKTFRPIRISHPDHHDLWIAPDDPLRMIEANDGGAQVSVNGGESWTGQDYPTAQFYHVITTADRPYHVCGAQQDNTTICVSSAPARSARVGAIGYPVGGGEAGYIATHPTNPDIFYAGHYDGYLTRFDRSTGQIRNIQAWPEKTMGHPSSELTERFQWTSPVVISPADPTILYSASQHLWRTTNEGQSWTRISPDLTRRDPQTQAPAPDSIRQDRTGADTYATIFAVAASRHDRNLIWTGSDDGLVHLTRDGGRSWTPVTPKALPPYSRVSMIEASPHQPSTAFLAANRYQMDDRAPYVFRTDDYGATWTPITAGIAAGHFPRAIREDPIRAGLLYAGTEHGVYVSFDRGNRWRSLRLDMPDTQISDLIVTERDLIVATHGRSFWVLDDIAPLRQIAGETPSAVRLLQPFNPMRRLEPELVVDYVLPESTAVRLEILDSAGSVIRSFESEHARGTHGLAGGERGPTRPTGRSGLNRFRWDLRYPGFERLPGLILWYLPNDGPVAIPGRYRVRLTAKGTAQEQAFEVLPDPGTPSVTLADLRRRFELASAIRDRTTEAVRALALVRRLRGDLADRMKRSTDRGVQTAARGLTERLQRIEAELSEVGSRNVEDLKNRSLRLINKIGHLINVVESAEAPPTDQTRTVFELLAARLSAQLDELERLTRSDLPSLNQLLERRGLPPIAVGRAAGPDRRTGTGPRPRG